MKLVKLTLDACENASLLCLSRPPVNTLSSQLMQEVSQAIKQVEEERACGNKGWGLVLTAENATQTSTFSSGLDLTEMYNKTDAQIVSFWTSVQDIWLSLYRTKLATVCAINGNAPAGGFLLTLACDHRVGVSSCSKSMIGPSEAKFGLVVPDFYAATLRNVVGARRCDRLLQLGELLNFEQALQIGAVDELVEKEKLVDVSLQRASAWATNGPPDARYKSKMISRGPIVDQLLLNRQADTDWFVRQVQNPQIQKALETYLASLKRG